MRLVSPSLPAWAERAWARIQDWTDRVIGFFQPIVVKILLVLVYWIGVGSTRLICMLFYRSALRLDNAEESNGSFWREAEGYTPDPVALHKQY